MRVTRDPADAKTLPRTRSARRAGRLGAGAATEPTPRGPSPADGSPVGSDAGAKVVWLDAASAVADQPQPSRGGGWETYRRPSGVLTCTSWRSTSVVTPVDGPADSGSAPTGTATVSQPGASLP